MIPLAGAALPIDGWLLGVRAHVAREAPAMLALLDPYIGEARHGRNFIAGDLAALAPHAHVLEIGAGSLLLSCQLVREGFRVTALEPVASGFAHFEQMQGLVLDFALAQDCAPAMLRQPAEQLALDASVDFAFSINVMEHIDDVACVIGNVARALKAGARYRFTCPNYLFPYEPHFHIPTLFSKALTARVFHRRIFERPDLQDPAATWESLNWITVPQVARIARTVPDLESRFGLRLLVATVERVAVDAQFAARHAGWMRNCLLVLMRLRLHLLFGLVPATLQPIMDCVLTKQGSRRPA